MPGLQVRWRGLRRRGVFPDPERDLPQWEAQILDALGSLAIASAERWVMAGPVSGSTGSAIQAALGQIQPGWLLRIAPTGLTCDIALPDLGREGTGRQVAIQHTGAGRSALRLEWGGSYVAACTSPGQVAVCVWDGTAWRALSGAVEWADVPGSQVVPTASSIPLVAQTIGNWSCSMLCFPAQANTCLWSCYKLPRAWIGTDVSLEAVVIPLVSAAKTALMNGYWIWTGLDGAPALVNFAVNPPQINQQLGVAVSVTAANYGQPRRVPFTALPTGVSLLSTLDAMLFTNILRNGAAGGDTYTNTYSGGANNLALASLGIRAQVCSHGVTIAT